MPGPAKLPTLLAQDPDDLLGEEIEAAGQPRRHDVEAVCRAVIEAGLDVIGNRVRRTGDHPVATRAGEAPHELPDRRLSRSTMSTTSLKRLAMPCAPLVSIRCPAKGPSKSNPMRSRRSSGEAGSARIPAGSAH